MQTEVRLLGESDLPAALRLKELAEWNQTEDDWRRLLSLEPNGCFCATIDGEVVGTTTTTTYGSELAWIGMVLVDPNRRKLGIGTRLMCAAVDYLSGLGVSTIKLDATPAGLPLYERLGFKEESLVERWQGIASQSGVTCSTLDSEARNEALVIDRDAFGADRSKLIELLIEDSCLPPLKATAADGLLSGFALAREGSNAVYLGPLVANGAGAATSLLDGLLSFLAGKRVYIDLNTNFVESRKILSERGLVKQRDLVRMSYGKERRVGTSPLVFAIAGPETG
jgi:GNAT superfamily N-acetyltransferase